MVWLTEDVQHADEGQAVLALAEGGVDQPHDPQEQRLRAWSRTKANGVRDAKRVRPMGATAVKIRVRADAGP